MSDRFVVITGPNVIESDELLHEVADSLQKQYADLPIDFYFKASFDKANRSSVASFRGPGLSAGLKSLGEVKKKYGFKTITDYHLPEQADALAETVDVLQIPAFLCRQTDLVLAGAEAAKKNGRVLNVKKGQFLAPWDTRNIAEKVRSSGYNAPLWMTERGTSFGYGRLTVDMSAFQEFEKYNLFPVYDATHSVQLPGGGKDGKSTAGVRENIEVLARAAVAAGTKGVFFEVHPNPDKALCDGPNAIPLKHAGDFVGQLLKVFDLVSGFKKNMVQN